MTSDGALPDKSLTKSQKNPSNKRTRQSPNKKVAKELFTDEQAGHDNGDDDGGVPANAKTRARQSPNKRVAKTLFAEEQGGESGGDSGGSAATTAKDSPSSAA